MEACSLLRSSFSGGNNNNNPTIITTTSTTNILLNTPQLFGRYSGGTGDLTARRCSSTPSATDLAAAVVMSTAKWQLASKVSVTKHQTSIHLKDVKKQKNSSLNSEDNDEDENV